MKLLVTHDIFVPSIDGPTFVATGTLVDVEANTAASITSAGRALYVDGKDDPTRRNNLPGQFTATDAQIEAAKAQAKARAEAEKAKAGTKA